HGVGASVVNALSKELTAIIKRNGYEYRMDFRQGKSTGKLKRRATKSRGTGTTITFRPDPQIFPRTEFNADTIRDRLEIVSFIHKGVKVNFTNDVADEKQTFQHEEGIAEYLRKIVQQRKARPVHDNAFLLNRKGNGDNTRIELVLHWTEATDEHIRSFVNGIPTGSGGTHENGLRAGLSKAIRNYIETHSLQPRGVKLAHEDLREGLHGILSIFLSNPQFQGQTKDRLNNTETQPIVDAVVRQQFEQWLNNNGSAAEAIVARIIAAARAREASRAASASVSRKTATSGRVNLPGKLSDCTSNTRHDSELFIVEGDSAGGSAKQGRDRAHQAILPLRGKVLNTEGASLKKVLDNKELGDLVLALGCGMGGHVDLSKLRYQRVILLADADSDGHHITTLLLTFFYRFLLDLIRDGRVYVAVPPLYRVDIGKETYWAADDDDRQRIIDEHGNGKAKVDITRFKGLGEMMPKTLWETTLNPKTRRLYRVDIADAIETDRVVNELMGKDASARFRFIMERAEEAEALDV
ncbi:MAG: toprim domain-containing protein, partial [Rhodospirillales bacterium]|nr:toprim domain-containing protein [Rhodospirillales bacterium]